MKAKSLKGFTIIELMIAITIMVVLLGMGVVSLNRFNSSQKVQSARDELISNLKLARGYATSMQVPAGLNRTLDSTRVVISGVGITVMAVTVIATGETETHDFFQKVIVPNGIVITNTAVGSSFDFMGYKGDLRNGSGIGITLSSAEVGSTATIQINNSGLINEK